MMLMSFVCFVLAAMSLYNVAAFCTQRDWWGAAFSTLTCVSCQLVGLLCAGVIGA